MQYDYYDYTEFCSYSLIGGGGVIKKVTTKILHTISKTVVFFVTACPVI